MNCETYTAGIKQKPDLNNNHTVSHVLTLKMTFRNIVHLYTFVCFFTSYIYFVCERSYLSLGDVISEASLCSCAAVKWQKAAARTAPILTDCHERVGELVLLFG